jgi:hypothetical protein
MSDENAANPVMDSDASQNEKQAGKPQASVDSVDLPDPDAHLSPEERKAIVCPLTRQSLHF